MFLWFAYIYQVFLQKLKQPVLGVEVTAEPVLSKIVSLFDSKLLTLADVLNLIQSNEENQFLVAKPSWFQLPSIDCGHFCAFIMFYNIL